jgi:hypothetical protein
MMMSDDLADSNTTTEAKVKRYKQRMQRVGLIEIKVFRLSYGERGGGFDTQPKDFLKAQDTKNVPERAVKGEAKFNCTL